MLDHRHSIIDIKRSPQLTFLLFFIHGLAVVALFFLTIPLTLTVIAILLLMFSLSCYLKKTYEVIRIVTKQNDEWLVQKTDGSVFSASLAGHTYVSDRLILLVFTVFEKRLPTCVCLMKDSLTASDFSLLKLKLKVFNQQLNTSSHNGFST